MAASDARRIIKNAAYRATFPIRDSSGQVVSAAASLDSEISKDGGSFTDCTNEATELAASSGVYYLDLTATEMEADQIAVRVVTSSGNTQVLVLEPVAALDSGVAQSGGASSLTLRSSASGTNDLYNGATLEIVRGTGAGQVRTITDYVGSTTVATVDRAWITQPASDSVYVIHPRVGVKHGTDIVAKADMVQLSGDATAADSLEAVYEGGVVTGSINDGSPAADSFVVASALSATDDFYNTQMIVMTSGNAIGQAQKISDYVGSSRTMTLSAALPATPANGDTFVILSRVF